MKILCALAVVIFFGATQTSHAQIKVDVTDGGSVITTLSRGIQVNDGSSLKRSFVTINDLSAPITLQQAGVATVYEGRAYNFIPKGDMTPREPITAVEVRFVLFDMFGQLMKTVSLTRVRDFGTDSKPLSEGGWYASEGNVRELLTVASFVAYVRTASGKVWRYDAKRVGEELQKLNLRIAAGALEPNKEERRQ